MAMSESIAFGSERLLAGVKRGTVIVDSSTVRPADSRSAPELCLEPQVHFLDAPGIGSKPGAEGGTSTFIIGGDQTVYESVKLYFELIRNAAR